MVVIQTDRNDHSTNDVLDWIFYFQKNRQICRINNTADVGLLTYRIGTKPMFKLGIGQYFLDGNTIDSFWYRRGRFSFHRPGYFKSGYIGLASLADKFVKNVDHDQKIVLKNVLDEIATLQHAVNKPADAVTDKIENLKTALACGLNIPETIITNDAKELHQFAKEHPRIITKSLDYSLFTVVIEDLPVRFSLDTAFMDETWTSTLLARYESCFCSPALYQQYIDKEIELRIFYLNGELFPMAIFSQSSELTKLDFRNYDAQRPNRTVPFKVSGEVKQKLVAFMDKVGLNSGSIDMILTPDGNYYFLEINPIGRYQWLAKSCNYPIDRKIAETLTS